MSRRLALAVGGLCVRGPQGQKILDGFDLELHAGEVTALIGETGSGKTTVLNSILGLLPGGLRVSSGTVRLEDDARSDVLSLGAGLGRDHLGIHVGYVPQDVRSGLNPLMTARATVLESARRIPNNPRQRADEAMLRAGLSPDFVRNDADRRPGRLSGGQCQRVLIAQAIVNRPRVLLLDEPTASLDQATRREVQDTIRQLSDDRCAVCLVTHDLAGLKGLADRVGVLYHGRIVEMGGAEEVLDRPLHPYTRGLLACLPRLDRHTPLRPIPGESPSMGSLIPGCTFHPRCDLREGCCAEHEPVLRQIGPSRKVACHVVDTDGS